MRTLKKYGILMSVLILIFILTCNFIILFRMNRWIYRIQETDNKNKYVVTIITRDIDRLMRNPELTRCNLYKVNRFSKKLIMRNFDCSMGIGDSEPYPQIGSYNGNIYILAKATLYTFDKRYNKSIVSKNVKYFIIKKNLLVFVTHYGRIPIFVGEANPRKTHWPDIIVYDLSGKKKRIYKVTVRTQRPEISPDGKKIAFFFLNLNRNNRINGTRIVDPYSGKIVNVIPQVDMCGWYDVKNLVCRKYRVKYDTTPKRFIEYYKKYKVNVSPVGFLRRSAGISLYNIENGAEVELIKTDYKDEEMTHPMRFGKKIVYFKPATRSMWLYDIDKKTNERVGYNVNGDETLPTQDGRLAVKFYGPEDTMISERLGMFGKIKRLLFGRKSSVVVVEPEKIREPLK